jgi:hypothetical protein
MQLGDQRADHSQLFSKMGHRMACHAPSFEPNLQAAPVIGLDFAAHVTAGSAIWLCGCSPFLQKTHPARDQCPEAEDGLHDLVMIAALPRSLKRFPPA